MGEINEPPFVPYIVKVQESNKLGTTIILKIDNPNSPTTLIYKG